MEKHIKILLALSEEEFRNEGNELGAFIGRLNNVYVNQSIFFELERCKDLGSTLEIEQQQDKSQYFYLILGKRVENYIEKEFNAALELFKRSGTPKIYTYFKQLPEGENAEESVLDFMKMLDKQLGHFYSNFVHIDAIKLNLILEFIEDGQLSNDIQFKDGRAYLNQKSVLSLMDVPSYCKNEFLQQKIERAQQLDKELQVLKAESRHNFLDEELWDREDEIKREQKKIQAEIHQMEMDMLNMCWKITEIRHSGKELDKCKEKVIELFEQGDYAGAKNMLRDSLCDENVRQAEEMRKLAQKVDSEALETIRDGISEKRTLILLLRVSGLTKETVKEIIDIYETITGWAERNRTELKVFSEYAKFLINQKRIKEGIAKAEKLKKYYERENNVSDIDQWELLDLLGILYYQDDNLDEGMRALDKALCIVRRLSMNNQENYAPQMALTYNHYAVLLSAAGDKKKANEYCENAVQIYSSLSTENLIPYATDVIQMLENQAKLYLDTGQAKKAESFWRDVLNFWQLLLEKNPEAFEIKESVAATSYNLANLIAAATRREKEAEKWYRKSLILYGDLFEKNPVSYGKTLADICDELAYFLVQQKGWQKRKKDVESLWREVLKIWQSLSEENLENCEAKNAVAATSYNLAYLIATDTGREEEAEELYRKSLEIYCDLLKKDLEPWGKMALHICSDLSDCLVRKSGTKRKKIEELYKKSLEIYGCLSEENRVDCGYYMVRTGHNLASTYLNTPRKKEAESLWRKMLDLLQHLLEINPENCEIKSVVAEISHNLANLIATDKYRKKEAEELHYKSLTIYHSLFEENPDTYGKMVIYMGSILACFLLEKGRNNREKAEELYKESLEIYNRLSEENRGDCGYYLAQTGNDLAVVIAANEGKEAESLWSEALTILQCLLEKNPENSEAKSATAAISYSLANLFTLDTGREKEAEKWYRKSFKMHQDLFRENPEAYGERLAEIYNNLVRFLLEKGGNDKKNKKEAEKLHKEYLAIMNHFYKSNFESGLR